MTIEEMTNRCGEWLKGSGPDSDIVMSSRIRLARNLADYPFDAARISTEQISKRWCGNG
jgi:protein-arginine kinase